MKIKNPPWIYFIFLFPNYRVLSSLKSHQFLLLLIPRFTFILSYQSYFILPPLPPDPPLETPMLQTTMKTVAKSSANFSFSSYSPMAFEMGSIYLASVFLLLLLFAIPLDHCWIVSFCISLICTIPQNCATGSVHFYLTIQFSLFVV